jgi:predicted ATP-grasp superfamily ATP-dependent carboligase
LSEKKIQKILTLGADVVSLSTSVRAAGYQVYAIDYFGDQDLKRLCHQSRSILEQVPGKDCGQLHKDFNPEVILRLTKDFVKENDIDVALISSGLEDSPEILYSINEIIPILGNSPTVIKKVRDKTTFFRELKHLDIPCPETVLVDNFEEAKQRSKDIGYPVLIKSLRGFGGVDILKATDLRELKQRFKIYKLKKTKVLIQEFLHGKPASISLVSSNSEAVILSVNEQLIGLRDVFQEEPFGYCGNVVPLEVSNNIFEKCKRIANKIAMHFGLIGSNGIDLILSEEGVPYVIEVNPRFQGTLECIERVLGINIAQIHINACTEGILPRNLKKMLGFCVRLILFSPKLSIVPELRTFEGIRDIPLARTIIKKGEPLCSIMSVGKTRNLALQKARMKAKLIFEKL